jgi:hypothetical protein
MIPIPKKATLTTSDQTKIADQLKFRFFTGQKIVPMDNSIMGKAKTDAYIRLDYKSTKLKTKV